MRLGPVLRVVSKELAANVGLDHVPCCSKCGADVSMPVSLHQRYLLGEEEVVCAECHLGERVPGEFKH